ETIREYAGERLDESGETGTISGRHGHRVLEAAEFGLAMSKRGRGVPLAALESELDDVRAAIRSALDRNDDTLALRLTAALVWFWKWSGRFQEGLGWTLEALARTEHLPESLRAENLYVASVLAVREDPELARRVGEEALELYRATGDEDGVA